MKKKLLTTLLFFSLVMMARADRFGQIIVSNCYQNFVADYRGGSYNVIGGTVIFGSTNLLDFSYVTIYQLTDEGQVFLTHIECGEPIELLTNFRYIIRQPGALSGPVILNMVEPKAVMGDYNDDGCLAFGEPYQFTISPTLDGFCGFNEISYTGPTGIIHDNGYLLEADGYCTPPPGQGWVGGPRCIDLTVSLTLWPCSNDLHCPPVTFNNTARVCCNNCRPYGPDPGETKSFTGEEVILNIYPNPAGNIMEIQSTDAGMLEIYNAIGQLVRIISIGSNNKTTVDISALPQGNYIYRFYADAQQTITGKLMVIH